MKSYVVIGLGRFGTELAIKLYERGEEVLAIDLNDQIVDKIADHVTRAVSADARDKDILEKLGVAEYDRAVVAMGTDLEASAMITMNLKELHVPYILCKASNKSYRQILLKLGADRVVIPEWEMADKLAMGLTHTDVMEYIELSDEFGIVEMTPQDKWQGKTIRSLELRTRYGFNVLALRKGETIQLPPNIDEPLSPGSILVILGKYESFEKLRK